MQFMKTIDMLILQLKFMSSQNDSIELTITTWTSQPGELYEYNSAQDIQRKQFRSVQHIFPIPKSQIYYFFHLVYRKEKEYRYEYIIQRRRQLKSNLSGRSKQEINKLVLVGGIKIYKKIINGKKQVFIQPIHVQAIGREIVNGKYEKIEYNLPFFIVRTMKQGYPIRPKQLIKFGKVQFQIIEISNSRLREVEYDFDNEVMNLDQIHKQQNISQTVKSEQNKYNSQSSIKRQCRICFMTEQQEQNMLITPCDCKGSGEYIHLVCLKEWIHQKLKKMKDQADGAFYQTSLLFCQICKKKFPKAIIKNDKVYGLLKFLQESYPYIALKSKHQAENQQQNMFYVSFEQTDKIGVGRLLDNGVILQQQTVSRKHALFQIISQQVRLKDDKSKYGTLVYEQNMQIRLRNNLKAIQIGNAVFSYKIKEEYQKYYYY